MGRIMGVFEVGCIKGVFGMSVLRARSVSIVMCIKVAFGVWRINGAFGVECV